MTQFLAKFYWAILLFQNLRRKKHAGGPKLDPELGPKVMQVSARCPPVRHISSLFLCLNDNSGCPQLSHLSANCPLLTRFLEARLVHTYPNLSTESPPPTRCLRSQTIPHLSTPAHQFFATNKIPWKSNLLRHILKTLIPRFPCKSSKNKRKGSSHFTYF